MSSAHGTARSKLKNFGFLVRSRT